MKIKGQPERERPASKSTQQTILKMRVALLVEEEIAHFIPLLRSLSLDLVYGLTRLCGSPAAPPK